MAERHFLWVREMLLSDTIAHITLSHLLLPWEEGHALTSREQALLFAITTRCGPHLLGCTARQAGWLAGWLAGRLGRTRSHQL